MTELDTESAFEDVSKALRQHMDRFTVDQQLFMYALYKQALIGDAPMSCTSVFPGDLKKWNSWNSRRGMSQCDARSTYLRIGNLFLQGLHELNTKR
eukprot:717434-Pleurochrysis_carterae.AAC.1